MELEVQFIFRRESCLCRAFVDVSEYPCYIFVLLRQPKLINEFGEEVSIKNDFEILLPKKDDYPDLVELRQAIFDAIKAKPAFMFVRENYRRPGTAQKEVKHFSHI
ncbi:MAG: hypothetical protein NVS1B13_13800 [Flavisolibacter sp.]